MKEPLICCRGLRCPTKLEKVTALARHPSKDAKESCTAIDGRDQDRIFAVLRYVPNDHRSDPAAFPLNKSASRM